MKNRLPSDALTKPTRRAPAIIGITAGIAVIVAAALAGPIIGSNRTPAADPTPTMTPYVATLTQDEIDSVQHGADQQGAIIAADKAAADAAAAAQAQAEADAAAKAAQHSSAGGSVHGRKVPFIKSDDPQNAAGGDWDMSVCEGGSASTGADGTPYCD